MTMDGNMTRSWDLTWEGKRVIYGEDREKMPKGINKSGERDYDKQQTARGKEMSQEEREREREGKLQPACHAMR